MGADGALARSVPPQQWADSHLPTFFAGPVPQELTEEVLAMMLDSRPSGIRPMIEAFAVADLRPVLPRIQVPTLLLYGEADSRSPLPVAHALHAEIPRSELVVLPNVGHCTNVEMPGAFNTEVRRFLRTAR